MDRRNCFLFDNRKAIPQGEVSAPEHGHTAERVLAWMDSGRMSSQGIGGTKDLDVWAIASSTVANAILILCALMMKSSPRLRSWRTLHRPPQCRLSFRNSSRAQEAGDSDSVDSRIRYRVPPYHPRARAVLRSPLGAYAAAPDPEAWFPRDFAQLPAPAICRADRNAARANQHHYSSSGAWLISNGRGWRQID